MSYTSAAIRSGLVCLLAAVSTATAQKCQVGFTKTITKENSEYVKPWNWAVAECKEGTCTTREYYYTTKYSTNKRVDMSKPADGSASGSVIAKFTGLPPGYYKLFVYSRESENRGKAAIEVTSDGPTPNSARAIWNQNGNTRTWFDMEQKFGWKPFGVKSGLTFTMASSGGSIAYGGARVECVKCLDGATGAEPYRRSTGLPRVALTLERTGQLTLRGIQAGDRLMVVSMRGQQQTVALDARQESVRFPAGAPGSYVASVVRGSDVLATVHAVVPMQ